MARFNVDLPDDAEKAWEDGLSNDIIILGKRYQLPTRGGQAKIVRNYEDDRTLDIIRAGKAKGYPLPLSRSRPKKPQTMDDLKKAVDACVIHTAISRHARRALRDLVGSQTGTHFCINWNGVIYQYADVGLRTPHVAGHNDRTIGIDLTLNIFNINNERNHDRKVNFAKIQKEYEALTKEKLRDAGIPEEKIPELLDDYRFENPRSGSIHGGNQRAWGYTRKQYESLILLLRLLYRELDLEKSYPMTADGKVYDTVAEGEDAKLLKGIVGHWHYSFGRWDPGPGFDWARVLAGLQNEYNSLPIAWESGHNTSTLRDIDKVHKVTYQMMRNNETALRGGTFPMGPNQTWHGGIHLFPPVVPGKTPRYPVTAMFEGVVVAAHFEPRARELGHNNFVLLRHEIQVPKPGGRLNDDGTPQVTKLKFFSLYMHLDSMSVNRKNAAALAKGGVNWVQRFYDVSSAGDAEREQLGRSYAEAVEAKRRDAESRWERGELLDPQMEALLNYSGTLLEGELDKEVAAYLTKEQSADALAKPDKIAVLVNDDFDFKVSAGEVLGFAGALRDGDGDMVPTLHVEIFGNQETMEAIDLDLHAAHFRTPQRARGSDLTVRTDDMLAIFRDAVSYAPNRKHQIWPERRLAPEDITDFYARKTQSRSDNHERYREQLRRSITYHVSEWSDKVDWVASILGGNTWSAETESNQFKDMVAKGKGLFAKEIRKFLPFVWLTDDVAAAIGLAGDDDWDGRLYHFHPLHFFLWVSFYASRRQRVFRTNKGMARHRKGRRYRRTMALLIKRGKRAHKKGGEKWLRFQTTLKRALAAPPFGFTSKMLKDPAKQEAYQELKQDILRNVTGNEAGLHGTMEVYDLAYSHPKEVLEDLFDLPPHFEWRIGSDRE